MSDRRERLQQRGRDFQISGSRQAARVFPSGNADSAARHNYDFYLQESSEAELSFFSALRLCIIALLCTPRRAVLSWESTACRAPFINKGGLVSIPRLLPLKYAHQQLFLDVCGPERGSEAGPYLQVVVVRLAVGLVVVWVAHLIQQIDGEPPGQTGLGHKRVLPQTHTPISF